MGCVTNKNLCLFVGWLNIVFSFSVPVGQFLFYLARYEYDLTKVVHNEHFQVSMICFACCCVPWLIASILLVKGITENRHILMVSWIYLNYVAIILSVPVMVYLYTEISRYGRTWQMGLYYSIPFVVGMVILVLFLIPVRKLYKELYTPLQVLPLRCSMQAQQPEDNQRYMPIFDN